MIGLILIGSAVFAQPSETPWFINFNDGSRVVAYGDESDFDKTIFTVVEDTPWSEPGRTLPISKKDVKGHYRPTPVELESYYEAGWTAHGGIRIDTPHGPMWVFEEEYELAQRAAELASANEAVAVPEGTGGEGTATVSRPEGEPVALSFGQQWGTHIAVLTVGLGLSALATWFLILE